MMLSLRRTAKLCGWCELIITSFFVFHFRCFGTKRIRHRLEYGIEMIFLVDHEFGTALTIQVDRDRRNSTHRFGYSNEFVRRYSVSIHEHASRYGKISIEPSRPETTAVALNTDSIFVGMFRNEDD